jgi:alkylation response protein AidB-like acyl-CoA dehydrogenase
LYTTELANRVASESIDLMGGMGYCSGEGRPEGSGLEKLFRDAKIGTIYEGTSNMQLETIAKMLEKSSNRS